MNLFISACAGGYVWSTATNAAVQADTAFFSFLERILHLT
jgi:hypothetical protein